MQASTLWSSRISMIMMPFERLRKSMTVCVDFLSDLRWVALTLRSNRCCGVGKAWGLCKSLSSGTWWAIEGWREGDTLCTCK
jgi:hypothetical protein